MEVALSRSRSSSSRSPAAALAFALAATVGCNGGEPGEECVSGAGNLPNQTCIPSLRFRENSVEVPLEAPAEDDGFQLATQGVTLGPLDDDEWCETLIVPGERGVKYAIRSFDVAMTPHFHHLFVAKAPFGGAEETETEKLMVPGERVRCVGGAHVVYGSGLVPIPLQQGELLHQDYPEGVGLVVYGGQKISVNYHYLNTSSENAVAKIKLNFNGGLVSPDEQVIELQQFGYYNQDIQIPPHGRYASTMVGTFSQDVYVRDLFRHTHALGRNVPVHLFKGPRNGGPEVGEVVFTSTDYQNDPGWVLDPPLFIKAGDGFSFTCNWQNDHDYPVAFGPTADDEMCMLLGTWWVANPDEQPQAQDLYKFEPTDE